MKKPFIIIFLFSGLTSFGQPSQIDSLENILNGNMDDSTRMQCLLDLSRSYLYKNTDTAHTIAKAAYQFAKSLDDRTGMAVANNKAGIANYIMGDYLSAQKEWSESLAHYEALDNRERVAGILGNIGVVYRNQGDYPKALEYFLRAQTMYEELDLKGDIAINLGNIGGLYWSQGEFDKPIKYFFEALEIDRELGNENGICRHLGNIGLVYIDKLEYMKALEYLLQALEMAEKLENENAISRNLGNLATVCHDMKRFDEALEYYMRAQEMYGKLGLKKDQAIGASSIGSLRFDQGNFKEAERYTLNSLALSMDVGSLDDIKEAHKQLSRIYEKMGQGELALHNYKLFANAKDSLFNEDRSKEIGKLEAKHEFETAELERKRAEEEQAQKEAETTSRRDNLQYSGILIFLVLIFAGIFMLGRVSIPVRLAEGMIFFSFLLFFEFTLVLLDPYIEMYSSGAPAIKLGFNAVLAAMIFPLHALFEGKIKQRIVQK
ncbi:MAG: tetratricopeptide repeat protein [Flavobacteriales bacterium]|nr:tetratricopeptide repeat protein [Flavobacteriales bacterium]